MQIARRQVRNRLRQCHELLMTLPDPVYIITGTSLDLGSYRLVRSLPDQVSAPNIRISRIGKTASPMLSSRHPGRLLHATNKMMPKCLKIRLEQPGMLAVVVENEYLAHNKII